GDFYIQFENFNCSIGENQIFIADSDSGDDKKTTVYTAYEFNITPSQGGIMQSVSFSGAGFSLDQDITITLDHNCNFYNGGPIGRTKDFGYIVQGNGTWQTDEQTILCTNLDANIFSFGVNNADGYQIYAKYETRGFGINKDAGLPNSIITLTGSGYVESDTLYWKTEGCSQDTYVPLQTTISDDGTWQKDIMLTNCSLDNDYSRIYVATSELGDNSFYRDYRIYGVAISPSTGSENNTVTLSGQNYYNYGYIYYKAPTCGVNEYISLDVEADQSGEWTKNVQLQNCVIGENIVYISVTRDGFREVSVVYNASRKIPNALSNVTANIDGENNQKAKVTFVAATTGSTPQFYDIIAANQFGAEKKFENLAAGKGGSNCHIGGTCEYVINLGIDGKYTFKARAKNSAGTSAWTNSASALVLELKKVKTNNQFKDISSYPAKDSIIWVYQYGITTGTDSTHYSPKANVTRGQMAKFLWALAGSPKVDPKAKNPFKDIGSYPVKDQIIWLYNAGITAGTDATHFSPTASVTRGQMAAFLYNLSGKPAISKSWKNPFKDINSYPAKDQIVWLYNAKITTGTDATHFSPKNTVTRGQMAKFLKSFAVTGQYIN
ncbi:MAG: S-layer homology domain-containing protein, partial [Bifidobacteriaceae bacterium]|nr:S-layer homology domain-containing protein [Bifidobacteriaceae bacterium]